MEEERREHVAKMKKMEMEMEQVFEMKVKEKVQKLKDSEAEVKQTSEAPSFLSRLHVWGPFESTLLTLSTFLLCVFYGSRSNCRLTLF